MFNAHHALISFISQIPSFPMNFFLNPRHPDFPWILPLVFPRGANRFLVFSRVLRLRHAPVKAALVEISLEALQDLSVIRDTQWRRQL